MTSETPRPIVQIDIISDVVCPWCIIGFRQLDQALAETGVLAKLRWHPFELNPNMGAEGQNLREHIMEKYGSTEEQSRAARAQITDLGASLGFAFNFDDDSKIVNTFQAHQLLDWAEEQGRQHPLKLALFKSYFTDQQDVSDPEVLLACVDDAGLETETARRVLETSSQAESVRQKQAFWTSRGITGVPAMVFAGKYLVTGAQGVENYIQILERCLQEAA